MWAKVKSIGNYGTLKWQSKTSEWEAFIKENEVVEVEVPTLMLSKREGDKGKGNEQIIREFLNS